MISLERICVLCALQWQLCFHTVPAVRRALIPLCDSASMLAFMRAWSDATAFRAAGLLMLVSLWLPLDNMHVMLGLLAVWPSMASGVVFPAWVLVPCTFVLLVMKTNVDVAHNTLLFGATFGHTAWATALSVPRPCKALQRLGDHSRPVSESSLLRASALQLARSLRAGEITASKLVEIFICQAKLADRELNAMSATRFAEARREARAADARINAARGTSVLKHGINDDHCSADTQGLADLPPFLGVPLIAKECMEIEGLPCTAGLPGRGRAAADGSALLGRRGKTAPALARLQQAGFIILGSGNVSEGCMWFESYNSVYGRSANPYDVRRTPGGSSGGTSALVSAGAAPCGVTSDVGGSTRIPAFYNGIFGHKPTGGTVPNTRTVPVCEGARTRFCQIGPSTRHACDLMPMLRIMAGPLRVDEADAQDERVDDRPGAGAHPVLLGDAEKFARCGLRGLHVLNCYSISGNTPLVSQRDPELVHAQHRVVASLLEAGCKVVPLPQDIEKELRAAFDIWSVMLSSGTGHMPFRDIIAEGKTSLWVGVELIKLLFARSEHTLPALGLALVERLPEAFPALCTKLEQRGQYLRTRLREALGDGIMLYPTLPTCAPLHDEPLWRIFDSGATSIFNVMEFPVTAVPLGTSTAGLPLGIQVVANHGQDHRSIGVALALESANVAGWAPPCAQ